MILVFEPECEAELAVVRSILDAEGVACHVGPRKRRGRKDRPARGVSCIFVTPELEALAREVIAAHRAHNALSEEDWGPEAAEPSFTFMSRIRAVMSYFLK